MELMICSLSLSFFFLMLLLEYATRPKPKIEISKLLTYGSSRLLKDLSFWYAAALSIASLIFLISGVTSYKEKVYGGYYVVKLVDGNQLFLIGQEGEHSKETFSQDFHEIKNNSFSKGDIVQVYQIRKDFISKILRPEKYFEVVGHINEGKTTKSFLYYAYISEIEIDEDSHNDNSKFCSYERVVLKDIDMRHRLIIKARKSPQFVLDAYYEDRVKFRDFISKAEFKSFEDLHYKWLAARRQKIYSVYEIKTSQGIPIKLQITKMNKDDVLSEVYLLTME